MTENKTTPERGETRPGAGADYAEIYPVQLRLLCQGRAGHRRGRRAAVAASTAPGWRATRRTSGGCGSIRRCWLCRSGRTSAAPTGTIPSTSTFPTSTRTCSAMARGNSSLPCSRNALTGGGKAGVAGQTDRRVAWVATRSSPLATTSSARTSSGVSYIAEPGGSIRDDNVIDTCNKYGIAMAFTGMRLFHH